VNKEYANQLYFAFEIGVLTAPLTSDDGFGSNNRFGGD